MKIGIGDILGARLFVDFVKEYTQGHIGGYQKFLDLVDEINREMLFRFEEDADVDDKEVGGNK